ncbi:MAG TPA: amino acid ABC transporter permease [Actinomycetota bacterium]|nr:amino acid ABC transporter permease [Actinomycetota bacterium]
MTGTVAFLFAGFRNTLLLVVIAFGSSLVVGTFVAVCRVAPVPILPRVARAEVELFRNTPLLIQMFFLRLALPSAGIHMSAFAAAALALCLYTAAYVTEVVRSGISSVGKGQMEASRSLGLGFVKSMRLVALPQAFRTVVPPLGNLMIAMVKNSAIAAAIGFPELVYQAEVLNGRTARTFELFTLVALGFWTITLPLSFGVSRIERRMRILR